MKTLLPNRDQWTNWSLPSKATYIGMATGVLGIVLAIAGLTLTVAYSYYQSIAAQDSEDRVIGKFEELFNQNEADWLLKYPSGFIMFGVNRMKVVESYHSSLTSKYRIKWADAAIEEFSESRVVVKLPEIVWSTYNLGLPADKIVIDFPDSTSGGLSVVEMDLGLPDKVCAEFVTINKNRRILVVGFKPGKAKPPPWDSTFNVSSGELFEFVNTTLKNNYPGGYVLMIVNEVGISTSRLGWADKRYSLDWSEAKVLELSDSLLQLRLPTMSYRGLSLGDNKVAVRTSESPVGKTLVLPIDLGSPHMFVAQVLEKWNRGYFMVIGLVPREWIFPHGRGN